MADDAPTAPHDPSVHTPLANITVRPRTRRFGSDDRRVLARFFAPGEESRRRAILERILSLSGSQAAALLDEVWQDFAPRHPDIGAVFRDHAERMRDELTSLHEPSDLSDTRWLLLGAFFTNEYSFESAALFNPSMVRHPDQEGLSPGETRFLMSLRAVGEGHISSIAFRDGIVGADGSVRVDHPPRQACSVGPSSNASYEKRLFLSKLWEMGEYEGQARRVLDPLPEIFTRAQMEQALGQHEPAEAERSAFEAAQANMRWLTEANYDLAFPKNVEPDQIVIFPATELEQRGMEDLRLVCFHEDDGSHTYCGTYTAFDGVRTIPMMLETCDFRDFSIHTLNGSYVRNKGMALFPRKVGGHHLMVSRHDGENLHLLYSDHRHFWNAGALLQTPKEPWEFVQIGNCGSPVETEEGWILLTHGVGAVRRYCIGALLLEREDPFRVIGRLRRPLLVPTEEDREGYVPNVVYSCGPMRCGDELIIPYAMADEATAVVSVPIAELLDALRADGP